MIATLGHLLGWLFSTLRSREDLILDNPALRQQSLVLSSQRPRRRVATAYKLFRIAQRTVWSDEKAAADGTPSTGVAWYRAGVSVVLQMAVTSHAGGRQEGGMQAAARLDFGMATVVDSTTATRLSPRTLEVWSSFV